MTSILAFASNPSLPLGSALINLKNLIGGCTFLRGICCSYNVFFVSEGGGEEYIVYEPHADVKEVYH
jgi:hypothetical protein